MSHFGLINYAAAAAAWKIIVHISFCTFFVFFPALFLMQIYKATNHIVSINIPLSLPHMDLWMIGLLFVVVVVVFLFPFGTFSLLPDARKKKKTCINLPARQFCICCEQHLLCCLVGGDKQPFTSSCSAF